MKVGNATIPAGAIGLVTQVIEACDDVIIKFNHGNDDDEWEHLGIVRVAMEHVKLRSVPTDHTEKYQKFSYESALYRFHERTL